MVRVVAIASSAGGLQALTVVLSGLPKSFPAVVLAVQHLDRRHPSLMAELLSRRTALPTTEAEHGAKMRAGHVYIAPPDHHLLVEPNDTIALTQTQLVHFVRPSADLLFESVAATYGRRAIGVVLSGTGSDAASGAEAIRKMGGIVIAQDEASAEFFGMPGAAIATGCVDYILPLDDIPSTLVSLMTA